MTQASHETTSTGCRLAGTLNLTDDSQPANKTTTNRAALFRNAHVCEIRHRSFLLASGSSLSIRFVFLFPWFTWDLAGLGWIQSIGRLVPESIRIVLPTHFSQQQRFHFCQLGGVFWIVR
jgi:hypothetical protein